jgi:hypothetical protein
MVLWYDIGHVYIDDYLIVDEVMCKKFKDNQFHKIKFQ